MLKHTHPNYLCGSSSPTLTKWPSSEADMTTTQDDARHKFGMAVVL